MEASWPHAAAPPTPHPGADPHCSLYTSSLQLQRVVDNLRHEHFSTTAYHNDLLHRLHESEATIATLRSAVATFSSSATAIDRLSRALAVAEGPPSDSGADDDEQSLTELLELRRWRREFSIDQTRGLVARCDELMQQNIVLAGRLARVHGALQGAALRCPRCNCVVHVSADGGLS